MGYYSLKITPEFYLLHGKGQGNLTIDNEFVSDKYGLLYIPGKTIKGLLKESFQEILEMSGRTSDIDIEEVFGKDGYSYASSAITVSDGLLPRYKEMIAEIDKVSKIPAFHPLHIKKQFLSIISQTAINKSGIAEDGSLRHQAALDHIKFNDLYGKEKAYFECQVTLDSKRLKKSSKKDIIELLEQAATNLKYAGLSRNRGLGKVSCKLVKLSNLLEEQPDPPIELQGESILVKMILEDPVIIGSQLGDQNTIASGDTINGGKLLGLLAYNYIAKNSVDSDFHKLFLSGDLTFEFLSKNGAMPAPLNIQYDKYNKSAVYDLFSDDMEVSGKRIITKPFRKQVTANGICQIHKTSSFHTKRNNRWAGSSLKDDGAAFYYESLDRGQTFLGRITGNAEILKLLVNKIGRNVTGYMGVSKSSQYGKVRIELKSLSLDPGLQKSENYYALALSPTILLDDNGSYAPDANSLAAALSIKEIDILSAFSRTCYVHSYNTQWKSRTLRHTAIKEGSVFLIKNYHGQKKIVHLGEETKKGYGKFIFFTPDEMAVLKDTVGVSEKVQDDVMDVSAIQNPLLKKVLDSYENHMQIIEMKRQAFSDIKAFPLNKLTITNSAIGRLSNKLLLCETQKIWQKAYVEIVEAKLKDRLKDTGLRELAMNKTIAPTFESRKNYWLFVLKLLRLKNRKRDE